jgi:hypothetical protein
MKTFLCVVSSRFPENYHIGIQARTWGVEARYENRIGQVSPANAFGLQPEAFV